MFVRETESGPLLVTSASDLTAASNCEFAFLRRVDAKLGRDVAVPPDDDPMLARAGQLGDVHEQRELDRLRGEFGDTEPGDSGGVVMIPKPSSMDLEALENAAGLTTRALLGRADVVFQATFFESEQRASTPGSSEPSIAFLGFADFLALLPSGEYEVQDTKLARRAKTTALLQLAAYAEQLERIGVAVASEATLILGSGERSRHKIADIAPVFRRCRARLHELLLERFAAVGVDGRREGAEPVTWNAPGIAACGRCEVCEPEVVRTRDPLLIAGINMRQRDALFAAGVSTIDEVARRAQVGALEVPGMTSSVLERIAMQAEVQIGAEQGGPPPVRVIAPHELAAIPEPNEGDLFFDFEGDPFYCETGDDGLVRWNLDYLFGFIDAQESFTPLWAHSLDEEREALKSFVDFVQQRRRQYPGMRIYHYASYERTHLLSIAARHGVCEADVDELLREHVLVDLYPIVRRALRVGSRSYSIKKLEPLYMGDELRNEDGVTSGAQSVVEFAEASALLRSSDHTQRSEGQRRLDAIADYNRYDCVSTLRLRDWLIDIARQHAVQPHSAAQLETAEERPIELSEVGVELLELAEATGDAAARTALKLASSAIDYHAREQKSFWWSHFARLIDPVEDWADTRDVVVVEQSSSEVETDWHRPPRARGDKRIVRLRGTIAPGSSLKPDSPAYAVYVLPAPFPARGEPGARAAKMVRIVERHDDGVTIEESLGQDTQRYDELPVALTPGPPPNAGKQKFAIEEWGRALAEATRSGSEFRDPVYDLLLRARPRLSLRGTLVDPASIEARLKGGGEERRMIGAVIASLRALDHSALAVQGPPGTGKTYLAAHVIRTLVEKYGWRIGVVAQSHKVVENVLEGVVRAGLDPSLVAKVPQGGKLDPDTPRPAYTVLGNGKHAQFLAEHSRTGAVIGGTAWDFSNAERIERRSLELLVVDEAGQFSLAPTIAASVSARRLLLLGDPQQLPQVSQGSHPEPVDMAALSWLLGDHETMPDEYGYFLAETRRMHPQLATVVSELSYENRLFAHPSTREREVVGSGCPAPGLHWREVAHVGNATSSLEEAQAVAFAVKELLGRESGGEATRLKLRTSVANEDAVQERSLNESDVIVVAAYNAQVECIVHALEGIGFPGVRVGTVDRFQGQEALFAIVSLAASSSSDIPRGIEFLLMRNRLNVAISRAQWASFLVSSPKLGDGLPSTAEGLAALSGYLRLTERG